MSAIRFKRLCNIFKSYQDFKVEWEFYVKSKSRYRWKSENIGVNVDGDINIFHFLISKMSCGVVEERNGSDLFYLKFLVICGI
jgi:hypothetical protein